MTQLDSFRQFVIDHGYHLTLGEMLRSPHAAEYRKEITFLRQEGWSVIVHLNRKSPSENYYTFLAPVKSEAAA